MAFSTYRDYETNRQLNNEYGKGQTSDADIIKNALRDFDNRLNSIESYLSYQLKNEHNAGSLLEAARKLRTELKGVVQHGVRMEGAQEAIDIIETHFPETAKDAA